MSNHQHRICKKAMVLCGIAIHKATKGTSIIIHNAYQSIPQYLIHECMHVNQSKNHISYYISFSTCPTPHEKVQTYLSANIYEWPLICFFFLLNWSLHFLIPKRIPLFFFNDTLVFLKKLFFFQFSNTMLNVFLLIQYVKLVPMYSSRIN